MLDADAAFDGERVLQSVADSGKRMAFPTAMGMLLRLADALARAHAVKPPIGPLVVGTLLPCQFLFDAGGRVTLLGLGDDVIARSAPAGVLLAPEVQLGQRPGRRTDGFALAALMRSLVPYTALPSALERVLRGVERTTERGIEGRVRDFRRQMWSAPPRLRPDAARLASILRVFLRLLGVEPDSSGFERFIAEVIAPEVALAPGLRPGCCASRATGRGSRSTAAPAAASRRAPRSVASSAPWPTVIASDQAQRWKCPRSWSWAGPASGSRRTAGRTASTSRSPSCERWVCAAHSNVSTPATALTPH